MISHPSIPKNVWTALKFQFHFQLMHFYCKSIFHNSRRMMKHRRVFFYVCDSNIMHRRQTLFIWFIRFLESRKKKVNRNFSNITNVEFVYFLCSKFWWNQKRVKISLTRDGKMNKALNMNRKLAFTQLFRWSFGG